MADLTVAILTVSDRSAEGTRPDQSGPILQTMMERHGWETIVREIVPDEIQAIQEKLVHWADERHPGLILTTGGTGFSPRDVTPEATEAICDRMAPGIAEGMRAASFRITPHAMLSRAVAGVRQSTLIINLPGSPKGAKENLEAVLPALKHAVQLLRGSDQAESGHIPGSKGKQV